MTIPLSHMPLQEPSARPASLEVPVENLHPDWHEDWGKTIRSPHNRDALLSNPRLASRITRDIVAGLQGGEIDPSSVARADLEAYALTIRRPERMRTLLGLANHAHMLFDMVSGEQVRKLTEKIDIADLRLALACRPLVSDTLTTRLAPERLPAAIESAGIRTLMEWSQGLPRPFATRLKLLFPKKSLFDAMRSSSDNHSLSRLVYHIAGEIARES